MVWIWGVAICFQAMEDERSIRETCLETNVFVQIRESSGAGMTYFTCTTYNCYEHHSA